MEPSRRNQWQSAANRPAAETAETSQICCRRWRLVAAGVNGKEGVDGSSPSEGSAELAANRLVSLAVSTTIQRRDVHQTSTRRLRDHSLALNSA